MAVHIPGGHASNRATVPGLKYGLILNAKKCLFFPVADKKFASKILYIFKFDNVLTGKICSEP